MIKILSFKRDEFDNSKPYCVKVCRPSVLGNPFHIGADGNRDSVCEKYADWLKSKLQDKNSPERIELIRLYRLYEKYDKLYLFCCCAPERCHADFIKFVLSGGLRQ